ncbi:MAG: hypothetical protein ACFFBP_14305 [Promethearchaeota archaeon]
MKSLAIPMVDELEFSLIICEFDDHIGPIPIASYPEIKTKFANQIAQKTIDFLFDEASTSTRSLAFLPFSSGRKKIISLLFEWDDEYRRGGSGVGSFSLVFRESDDYIYHRHIKDLEPIFKDASKQMIQLKKRHGEREQDYNKLKEIHEIFAQEIKKFTLKEEAPKTNYRTMNIIIQRILENILRAERNKANPRKGIIKSHLIDYCSLKSTTAEKYFNKLENAGYITSNEESWGQRMRIIYNTTEKGRERYQWFVQINTDMEAFN